MVLHFLIGFHNGFVNLKKKLKCKQCLSCSLPLTLETHIKFLLVADTPPYVQRGLAECISESMRSWTEIMFEW